MCRYVTLMLQTCTSLGLYYTATLAHNRTVTDVSQTMGTLQACTILDPSLYRPVGTQHATSMLQVSTRPEMSQFLTWHRHVACYIHVCTMHVTGLQILCNMHVSRACHVAASVLYHACNMTVISVWVSTETHPGRKVVSPVIITIKNI